MGVTVPGFADRYGQEVDPRSHAKRGTLKCRDSHHLNSRPGEGTIVHVHLKHTIQRPIQFALTVSGPPWGVHHQ